MKGDRRAQRNFMAKELQKKQYWGTAAKLPKKKYNRKERLDEEDFVLDDCPLDDPYCPWPECTCIG